MMRQLTPSEVQSRKVEQLGLDPALLDFNSMETIAEAMRRVARFHCPCAPATLIRAVVDPLRYLVDEPEVIKELVQDTLDSMITHGDLLEHRELEDEATGRTATLIYAAPSSFVVRNSGVVILLGISSDQSAALPSDIEARVEHEKHLRFLRPEPGEDIVTELHNFGFIELPQTQWIQPPPLEASEGHVARLDNLLNAAGSSGDVTGLWILDSSQPVHYYRGRWTAPNTQSGRFVARRNQAYGADLWCYIEMSDGQPNRLIDLPLTGSQWRGCDEAWLLQMAIDAKQGHPQQFRVRRGYHPETWDVQFFSPVPMWAQRRWDAIGEPVSSAGCLFAYKFSEQELEEELRLARDNLWLKELQ